jgi:hypothetical protein
MAMHDTVDAVEALKDFATDEAFNEASGAAGISWRSISYVVFNEVFSR